jgi:adenosylmethionine-8-amino-7-oxononanoate aminotransferase
MDFQEIKLIDKQSVMHTWSKNSVVEPKVISSAEGVYFYDDAGKKYLDFSSQLKCVNIGHGNKKIIDAIKQQAEKLCFLSTGFACEPRSKLARKLISVTPGDLNHFFFTLGGSEANENALKFAKMYTNKNKIISLYRSYHGATYGSVSLTGDIRRVMVEPGIPGVVHALNPHCFRCPFNQTFPSCDLLCAKHIEEIIQYEHPDKVAAIILETVSGAGGIIIPPDGYLKRIRELCDKYDILFIADEVMTGFGRTGSWFAVDNWDVVPDIITMAKGLTSAYLPLGAVAISEKIAKRLYEQVLYCGLTYSAHPLSCAAAVATLEVYEDENIFQNVEKMGVISKSKLMELKEKHPCVGDVRSIGLFSCMELIKDKKSKEPLDPKKYAKEINKRLMEYGMYNPVGSMQPEIYLYATPPLTITEPEFNDGIEILDKVLDYADGLTS